MFKGWQCPPLCILNGATAYTGVWICDNISYGLESGEFWQFMLPFEQLFIQYLLLINEDVKSYTNITCIIIHVNNQSKFRKLNDPAPLNTCAGDLM